MAVNEPSIVDAIGIDPQTANVMLAISDHLPWTDPEHFSTLERKLAAYVDFVESGQLLESYPEAIGRAVGIQVIHQHEPTLEALSFLVAAREGLRERGIGLVFGGLPADL